MAASRFHETQLQRLRVTPPVDLREGDDLHYGADADAGIVMIHRVAHSGAEYWEPFTLPPGRWMLVPDDGHNDGA